MRTTEGSEITEGGLGFKRRLRKCFDMRGRVMSRFDDAFELSVEAEVDEMGEDVYLDGERVMGVVSDIVDDHKQSKGGRRVVATFSIFVKKGVGEGIVKGCRVEVDGRKGRVIKREDLGGGGWEFVCGPVSSWDGVVPGV